MHHGGVVVERVIVVVPLKASVVLDVLRVILEVKEMLVELELCVTDTLVEVLECKIPVEVIVIVLLDVYVADVVLVELVVLTDDFVELVLVDHGWHNRWVCQDLFCSFQEKVCKGLPGLC